MPLGLSGQLHFFTFNSFNYFYLFSPFSMLSSIKVLLWQLAHINDAWQQFDHYKQQSPVQVGPTHCDLQQSWLLGWIASQFPRSFNAMSYLLYNFFCYCLVVSPVARVGNCILRHISSNLFAVCVPNAI